MQKPAWGAMIRMNMLSTMCHRTGVTLLIASCALAAGDGREALIRRLNSLADTKLEERARTIARIQTRADAERRQQQVRAKILSMIGGLPETRAPLNAKTAGTLARDGFTIEKVVFESLPAFYVTANVYVPAAGAGPFPAVVMTPGHSPTGKAGEYLLAANFARNGIVALAYDPMAEGERLQYFDASTGKSAVGGPTGEHSQASIADDLTGEHISRYFVWDAMRAIDYLSGRKDIDAQRIGAFGCSGGGTVTAYLAALDPRVKAAASACYITAFQDLLAAPTGVQEAEQTIPGFIAAGFDFADWVELAAPRPYAIVSTTNDMFPYAGAQRSLRRGEAHLWTLRRGGQPALDHRPRRPRRARSRSSRHPRLLHPRAEKLHRAAHLHAHDSRQARRPLLHAYRTSVHVAGRRDHRIHHPQSASSETRNGFPQPRRESRRSPEQHRPP